jgi:hypothetical protein
VSQIRRRVARFYPRPRLDSRSGCVAFLWTKWQWVEFPSSTLVSTNNSHSTYCFAFINHLRYICSILSALLNNRPAGNNYCDMSNLLRVHYRTITNRWPKFQGHKIWTLAKFTASVQFYTTINVPWNAVIRADSVRLSTVASVCSTAVLKSYERKPENTYRSNFSDMGHGQVSWTKLKIPNWGRLELDSLKKWTIEYKKKKPLGVSET